jgi:hypothetical protein
MSIDPTKRGATTQDLILTAIVDRLIASISEYNDQNCWETDDPVPLSHPGGYEFCTVSFGGGNFPTEFFAGGGAETLTEAGSVIIAPTVTLTGDRPRRRRRRLTGDSDGRNLMNRKRQILVALFGSDWEPVDGDKPLLRDLPSPIHCSAPAEVHVGESLMLQMRLTVATIFDWDLTDG